MLTIIFFLFTVKLPIIIQGEFITCNKPFKIQNPELTDQRETCTIFIKLQGCQGLHTTTLKTKEGKLSNFTLRKMY